MAQKSWQLDRRTFLRGAGISLSVPFLDGMSWAGESKIAKTLPKRLCGFYFPFGISHFTSGKNVDLNWFPSGSGKNFEFSKNMSSLNAFRKDLTVIQGLCHPHARTLPGHDAGDSFLTGVPVKAPNFKNGISVDQVAAKHIGGQTRFPSLVFSSDGGVGKPTRTCTISYNERGDAIPALADPGRIFTNLFTDDKMAKLRLERDKSMLDRLMESSSSLKQRLGTHDHRKMDEYLTSLRMVEKRIQTAQKWADVAKPKVSSRAVDTRVLLDSDPEGFIKTMYDLVFLALQTDVTRVATYQLSQNLQVSLAASRIPQMAGLSGSWHRYGHNQTKSPSGLGAIQEAMTKQFVRFLSKMDGAKEAGGSMLDRTTIVYGSNNAATHGNDNYPLIVAGGTSLGMKQGQYLNFKERKGETPPFSNVLYTMLRRIDVPVKSFADSTGELSDILA